jgi:hypothetical protein
MSQICLESSLGSHSLSGARILVRISQLAQIILYTKVLHAGSISHVKVLGQHMIVLNSVKTTMEMLDKKSSVYSDRPVLPMSGELVGWKHALVLLPYGDRFREYRKNIHRAIGSRAALNLHHPILWIETHRFLKRVLAKPDQLQSHVKQYA